MDEPLAALFEQIQSKGWAYGEYRVALTGGATSDPLASFGEGGEIAVASYFRRALNLRIKEANLERYSRFGFVSCYIESKSVDFRAQCLQVLIVANGMDVYAFRLACDRQGQLGLECALSKGGRDGVCASCAVC